ncbi:MAG: glycosyltransferase [Acidimicrobiales bacterium]|nr:glycosyltransferase [Acidimicrobiales bacterium]
MTVAPRRLAVLSMHTSPLAQPGTGDGGGMNVYVRELAAALARLGVECEVFTRADDPGGPAIVSVEPGLTVHHIPAGPVAPVQKESLPDLVEEWTDRVGARLEHLAEEGRPVAAIHANYWLSGVAGHALKHRLEVPLMVTFHTLDRVKADASPEELSASEPARRAHAEAAIVGCADAVIASCSVEADQLVDLYNADPSRIAIVAPGVEHAFFGPGQRMQARRAVGLAEDHPVVLFVGRIQPLKGPAVAVDALALVRADHGENRECARSVLVVIGGPSGPHGTDELAAVRRSVNRHGLAGAVRLLPPQRHEMLSTYFRAADACVVPSHSESFGLVALEAGACGVPVIASAVGGLTTLVDHGRTGYLVEGREAADYARPLAAVLGDPLAAARMGRAAAARARSYTWRAAARDLWSRVEELTASTLVAC